MEPWLKAYIDNQKRTC